MAGRTTEVTNIHSPMTAPSPVHFSGRQLARNSLYSLLGLGLPLIVAFLSVPPLIAGLGPQRFGLLSIAWLVVGYFNLFDFGIGLATTKLVAEYGTSQRSHLLSRTVWTSLTLMGSLGIIGGGAAFVLSPWIATSLLNVPEALYAEATRMFSILALGVPVMLIGVCFRSALEGDMQFAIVNAIKMPSSMLAFLGPLATLVFTQDLGVIAAVLVLSRVLAMFSYMIACFRKMPSVRTIARPDWDTVRSLATFGGWIAISSIISPLLVYSDRFILGALVTLQAVTYYVTPYELVTRLSVLPASLMAVLFPVFSAYSKAQQQEISKIYAASSRYLLAALAPIVIVLIGFAEPTLRVWVGQDLATQSSFVLQILAFGVLANSLARLPYSLIQASGRPDLTAKVHLLELPVYIGLVWYLVSNFGFVGAAVAWSVRVVIDLFILEVLAFRLSEPGQAVAPKGYYLRNAGILIATVAFAVLMHLLTHGTLLVAGSAAAICTTVAWRLLLTAHDRSRIIGYGRGLAPAFLSARGGVQ